MSVHSSSDENAGLVDDTLPMDSQRSMFDQNEMSQARMPENWKLVSSRSARRESVS